MSVKGEFRRVLADCAALVERSPQAAGTPWRKELAAAGRTAEDDLCRGAEAVLAFLERGDPDPEFPRRLEREEFARRREHLAALCGIVLGR